MELKFLGASGGQVTGSCYLLKTADAQILIDCGMFQGGQDADILNAVPPGVVPAQLNAVLVTHGHLDHTGRLPLLVKMGLKAPVYATSATMDLAHIILSDSARLQSADAMRNNRRNWKEGETPESALYGVEHVEALMDLFEDVMFEETVEVAEGITARWFEAGHMLGSGSIELTVKEAGKKKVILFSGDLGPINLPLLNPFETTTHADVVIMESTYGNRDHRSLSDTLDELEDIVQEAVKNKAVIVVPTFAVGRAQQMVYHLAEMFHEKKVKPFPVYTDSPMAIQATGVYQTHQDLLDEEYQSLKKKKVFPVQNDYFRLSPSAESSKALNDLPGPLMILAGAGMCNGGRILHHIRHHIQNPNNYIMFVGFQAHGSLGRRIVDGAKTVNMFGETLQVKANIRTLGGFSAHAGQTDLMRWFAAVAHAKPQVFITHGEDEQRAALAAKIKATHHIEAVLPDLFESVIL